MGVGRRWSKGHGNEFEILSKAFRDATDEQIRDFRAALRAGRPIMEARRILHGTMDLERKNRAGTKLGPWVPEVTQFRWYHPGGHFWRKSKSSPYQIDQIMRRALLECCSLWEDGCKNIEFRGLCERPEFTIRFREKDVASGARTAEFWLEVPDHWASYDHSGRDDEERDPALFPDQSSPGPPPRGFADIRPEPGPELNEGKTFDESGFGNGGTVLYDLIYWNPTVVAGASAPPTPVYPDPPPQEKERVEELERLANGAPRRAVAEEGVAASAAAGTPALEPEFGPPSSLHGTTVQSALDDPAAVITGRGRYGRLFDPPPIWDRSNEVRREEAGTIAADLTRGDNGNLPAKTNEYIDAIYTFFGQFIDHDVTFDSSSSLQRRADLTYVEDFRTPKLDLDSIYGGGPRQQPYLYDEHGRFVLEEHVKGDERWQDLPRTRRGVAIIVDPRNDQQAILSQLTVLFMRLHNAVIDGYPDGVPRSFESAQDQVIRYYQWLVVHHFLPTVAGPHKMDSFFRSIDGERLDGSALAAALRSELRLSVDREPWGSFMPVEFSAAAFRFGHSMVRATYQVHDGSGDRGILTHVDAGGLLGGPVRVDWKYFIRGLGHDELVQPSALIDPNLIAELGQLPPSVIPHTDPRDPISLPERTLRLGVELNLPWGQWVAEKMGETRDGVRNYRDIHPLEPSETGLAGPAADQTPLWYYILREAEHTRGGYRLGPLGATLVAEVLLGLLVHDDRSFLNEDWAPPGGDFTFADLVEAAAWTPRATGDGNGAA